MQVKTISRFIQKIKNNRHVAIDKKKASVQLLQRSVSNRIVKIFTRERYQVYLKVIFTCLVINMYISSVRACTVAKSQVKLYHVRNHRQQLAFPCIFMRWWVFCTCFVCVSVTRCIFSSLQIFFIGLYDCLDDIPIRYLLMVKDTLIIFFFLLLCFSLLGIRKLSHICISRYNLQRSVVVLIHSWRCISATYLSQKTFYTQVNIPSTVHFPHWINKCTLGLINLDYIIITIGNLCFWLFGSWFS